MDERGYCGECDWWGPQPDEWRRGICYRTRPVYYGAREIDGTCPEYAERRSVRRCRNCVHWTVSPGPNGIFGRPGVCHLQETHLPEYGGEGCGAFISRFIRHRPIPNTFAQGVFNA